MKIRTFIVWIAILSLIALIGCTPKTKFGKIGKPKTTNIADLIDNPEEYLNKECRVKGYVTTVKDIPYVKNDGFKIFDGTDEIWIYTERGVPPLNIRVVVRGRFDGLFAATPIMLTIPFINIQVRPEFQYFIKLKELEIE